MAFDRLEVRRLAVEHARDPNSQLRNSIAALRLVLA